MAPNLNDFSTFVEFTGEPGHFPVAAITRSILNFQVKDIPGLSIALGTGGGHQKLKFLVGH